eukprot:Skav219738  [mRNA]  locus=scaffold301:458598:461009:+ [translate_table: standard]
MTQKLWPLQALHKDVGEKLAVLQDGRPEKRVEGTFINLGIGQIHHVLIQVVCGLHLMSSREPFAQRVGSFKANAAHHDVARDEVSTGQNHSGLLEAFDQTCFGAQLLHVMSHKPNVTHRDGVAIMLHLLGPTFRNLTARYFIELLPPQELLDVALRVMFVLLIPGLHEIQVVDCLGANGAMTTRHHNDLCCTVF